MNILRNKKFLFILLVTLASVGFFLGSAEPAQAIWPLDGLADALLEFVSWFLYSILYVLGKFLELIVFSVAAITNFQISESLAIVSAGWTIVRNFANMFFIVILIVMAFATIFDVGSFGFPGYDVGSLLARFLVAALLINFSLVIGSLLVSGVDAISSVMLNGIGDFSSHILDSLKPTQFADNIGKGAITTDTAALIQKIPPIVFSIFMLIILVVCMLIALVVSIVRIPVIWLLLIFSPLAWLGSILPATKDINKKWWKEFIRWNTFMPIFLLTLYFGLTFLSGQEAILSSVALQVRPNSLGALGFTVNTIFYYFTAGLIFVGGTAMAISGGLVAGSSGLGIAQKARDAFVGGASRVTGLTAFRGAAKEGFQQLQKEGLPGRARFLYGGQAALDRQQAGFGRRLVVRGALEKGVGLERERLGRENLLNDPAKLQALAASGSREQRIAARQRLAELGFQGNAQQIKDTYQLMGGDRNEGARKYLSSLDYGKMDKNDRKLLQEVSSDIEVRRKVAEAMIAKGDYETVEELKQAAAMFGAGAGEFLDKGKSKKLKEVVDAKKQLGIMKPGELSEFIGKISPDNFIEIDHSLIDDEEVAKAVTKRFRDERFGSDVLSRVNNPDFLKKLQPLADEARKQTLGERKQKNQKDIAELQAKLEEKKRAFALSDTDKEASEHQKEIGRLEGEIESFNKGGRRKK